MWIKWRLNVVLRHLDILSEYGDYGAVVFESTLPDIQKL